MGDPTSSSSAAPRKMKFMPKLPPKKAVKVVKPKLEPSDGATSDVIDRKLLSLVKLAEQGHGRKPKNERKVPPMQVAFGHVDSRDVRSFGILKTGPTQPDNALKVEKEYVDPWNYDSYYPVTLPLRLPHTGNPETLDEVEFGESAPEYEEALINPAKELGLVEDSREQMLFLQLPASLPLVKRSAAASKGKEIETKRGALLEKCCKLEDLPAGLMGKLLVYKSGAIKMKLGDALFNVTPGSNCVFAQDVMAINTQKKHCCVLGELNKRAIVTPDLDSVLENL